MKNQNYTCGRNYSAGDRGGYTVCTAKTGWIVELESICTGDVSGMRVLIPYECANGTVINWGYDPDTDLNAAHNDTMRVGDAIAYLAEARGEDDRIRVLRCGQRVQ